jgi:glycosidase
MKNRLNSVSQAMRFSSLLSALLAGMAFAQTKPVVQKVEPPNWWLEMPNPMLLVKGENLSGNQVRSQTAGVSIARTKYEQSGHYLFLWLNVAADANSGPVRLVLEGHGQAVEIPFSLAKRRPESDGFQGFGPDDVIYLIMSDRFADGDTSNDSPPQSPGTYDRSKPRAYHGGDLRGIQQHLGYLHDLGATTIWLNPIYDNDNHSPDDYHGYAAVDFYAVDEHFGTLSDYQALVTEAHRLGMKVLLDIVVNHCGGKHPWLDSPPEPDWLNGTKQNHSISDGKFELIPDEHVPPAQWKDVVNGWFFNLLPDLNQNNPDVAQYILENAIWWAEEGGLDGFRLDTFPYVPRTFWSGFHESLVQIFPHFTTVGEVFHRDPTVTSFFDGGRARYDGIDTGVSTVFDFPLFFKLRDVLLKDKQASELEDILGNDWLYSNPDKLVTFLGNHDTVRFMGEPGATREKLKAAFALLLTMRGIPQIYYGDEIGMPGGVDPDNRRDFPGGFPGDARNAFTQSGRTRNEENVFAYVQHLLHLRLQHPALRQGTQWYLGSGQDYFAYARTDGDDRLVMIFNNADHPNQIAIDLSKTPLADATYAQSENGNEDAQLSRGKIDVDVPARTVAINAVR